MGCGLSKERAENPLPPSQKYLEAQPPLSHGFHGKFPTIFHLYYTGRKKRSKADYFVLVAEIQGRQEPMYAVKFRMGNLDTKSCVRLYSGTDRTSVTLSSSGTDTWNDPYSFISLPSNSPGEQGVNQTERLMHIKGGNRSHFSLGVRQQDGPSSIYEETFAWQSENMLLASGSKIQPWELIRTGVKGSNHHEIVATWTELPKMDSQGKIGTFCFQNSGATGELGEYWALMSVSTFLNILYSRYVLNRFLDQMSGLAGGLLFGGIGMAF